LPAPDLSALLARTYAAPEGDVETAIALLWQELLGVPKVGRHDHFFELGGNSLMITTLIARLRQSGLHTDVRSVFTSRTLAALAATVTAGVQTSNAYVAPPNLIPDASSEAQTHVVEEEIRL